MDIRVARTDRAIEKAFMELRAKNPLEKIKIKDLCALACINKSTFYAHYEDIYALSSGLETKVIGSILACVTDFGPNRPLDHTEELTQGLFRAFVQNQRAVNILFSGSRQGVFANSIEQGLRKRVAELDPTFTADLKNDTLVGHGHILVAKLIRSKERIRSGVSSHEFKVRHRHTVTEKID